MENTSRKSRGGALVLAFLLGALGVHRFYVGKVGTGIVMLVCSITVVGLIVSGIWTWVDIFLIATGNFKDKNGLVLEKW